MGLANRGRPTLANGKWSGHGNRTQTRGPPKPMKRSIWPTFTRKRRPVGKPHLLQQPDDSKSPPLAEDDNHLWQSLVYAAVERTTNGRSGIRQIRIFCDDCRATRGRPVWVDGSLTQRQFSRPVSSQDERIPAPPYTQHALNGRLCRAIALHGAQRNVVPN
jgi:hypothetical protein